MEETVFSIFGKWKKMNDWKTAPYRSFDALKSYASSARRAKIDFFR